MRGLQEPCEGSQLYGTHINLAVGTAMAPNGLTARVSLGLRYLSSVFHFETLNKVNLLTSFSFRLKLTLIFCLVL